MVPAAALLSRRARGYPAPVSDRDANVVASYDRVAGAYAAHFDGGISVFYAIVHLTAAESVHLAEMPEQPVDLDFTFFARAVVERALEEAGFGIAAVLERVPYTPMEHPTQRGYLLARKPS